MNFVRLYTVLYHVQCYITTLALKKKVNFTDIYVKVKYMINRNLYRLFCGITVIVMVFIGMGCAPSQPQPQPQPEPPKQLPPEIIQVPVFISTDAMPLTVSILNSLRDSKDFDIEKCQFFLSGKIILERNDEEETQGLVGGKAVFEDNYTRKLITIEDQTAGLAFSRDNPPGNELSLCFEDEDEYKLVFSAGREDSSQFLLKFDSQNDPLSGTRGSLVYGGQPYRLRFTGGVPYLSLKLEIKGTPGNDPRTARGRKVEDARISATDTPVPLTIDILNRLKRSDNFNISGCQFYISGKILLERIDEKGNVYIVEGKAVFEYNNTTKLITIDDQTEGIALRMSENSGGTDLYLCFDTEDNYQIRFSAAEGPNNRFTLQYDSQNDPLSDARGTLNYGDQAYRLRFSGGTPFLLLSLSQSEAARVQERTAPGRRVTP